MARLGPWLQALVFRAPMGAREALVLVVTGGVVVLTGTVGPAPIIPAATDPQWAWLLWWIVIGASLVLFARGLVGLVVVGRRGADIPFWWLEGHLPFTVRSPIVRRPRRDRQRALGILDFELAIRESSRLLLAAYERMLAEVGRSTDMMNRYAAKQIGPSLNEQVRDAAAFGRDLDRYARRLEKAEKRIRVETQKLVSSHLQRLGAYPDGADLTAVRELMANLHQGASATRVAVAGNLATLGRLRAVNVYHTMNEAVDRTSAAISAILEDFEAILALTVEALAVIDAKPLVKRA